MSRVWSGRGLKLKIDVVEPTDSDIERCKQFFPAIGAVDVVHTAACLTI